MTAGVSSRQAYTLQEWLQWQETLHPSVIDLGLARIHQVAHVLFGSDFLAQQPLTITVAGTNGKGSCVTALAVLLHGMGKHVGSFTSPHLFRYNERIRINNEEVSDADLCAAFAAIDAARSDISLTYFEFNALAAFWIFRQHQVDVQVLEVGLGGRLDAANLIDADIAVITNIALDHVDWLGDTREKIGAEKAGILRENGKLVYGEADMPSSISELVNQLNVDVRQAGRHFSIDLRDASFHWQGVYQDSESVSITTALPQLPLPSVACALQVLAWLGCWDNNVIDRLLPDIFLAGRVEKIYWHNRKWIFDVAHNVASAQFLANRLQRENIAPFTAIFSAMTDKDLAGIFSVLSPVARRWFLFPLANNPRAATNEQLHIAALEAGIAPSAIECCIDAQTVMRVIEGDESLKTVLVCGSFFTVSAIREMIS